MIDFLLMKLKKENSSRGNNDFINSIFPESVCWILEEIFVGDNLLSVRTLFPEDHRNRYHLEFASD